MKDETFLLLIVGAIGLYWLMRPQQSGVTVIPANEPLRIPQQLAWYPARRN